MGKALNARGLSRALLSEGDYFRPVFWICNAIEGYGQVQRFLISRPAHLNLQISNRMIYFSENALGPRHRVASMCCDFFHNLHVCADTRPMKLQQALRELPKIVPSRSGWKLARPTKYVRHLHNYRYFRSFTSHRLLFGGMVAT